MREQRSLNESSCNAYERIIFEEEKKKKNR